MDGSVVVVVVFLVRGSRKDQPGTSMRLNSASTLVFVDGRIRPNWARVARRPTIVEGSMVSLSSV